MNFDCLSNFTSQTQLTNLTLNLGGNPYLAPLKDVFLEFKNMVLHKPSYRNKGQANNVYRNSFTDARTIYHNLLEVVNDFVIGAVPFCS